MFVKLQGRRVLVIGAGEIAEQKIRGLLATGALVHVVALQATDTVQAWARSGQIILETRTFVPSDVDGQFLVVAATSSQALNEQIFEAAQARGALCNIVDVPELCDFYYPAVVQRGDLQIAISTAGQSPSLAAQIRQRLERQFGTGYSDWVRELGETRRLVLSSDLDRETKRELLNSLASREAFQARVEAAKVAEPSIATQGPVRQEGVAL
jgi:precorrin-2 dehydrogenase/sirohydrochlorin ferrochelatase